MIGSKKIKKIDNQPKYKMADFYFADRLVVAELTKKEEDTVKRHYIFEVIDCKNVLIYREVTTGFETVHEAALNKPLIMYQYPFVINEDDYVTYFPEKTNKMVKKEELIEDYALINPDDMTFHI